MGLEAWRKTKGIASIDLRRPTCVNTRLTLFCTSSTQSSALHGCLKVVEIYAAGCQVVMLETACLEQAMELMPQQIQLRLLPAGTSSLAKLQNEWY